MRMITGSDINMVYKGAGRLSRVMTALGFRRTMPAVDGRLPEMTQGLGVFEGDQAVFYPMDSISEAGVRDNWRGKPVMIRKGKIDRIPFAVYEEDESKRPMQLLMRWYGFCLTFPHARIYGDEGDRTSG